MASSGVGGDNKHAEHHAQQPGGQEGQRDSESQNGRPVCCSAWFDGRRENVVVRPDDAIAEGRGNLWTFDLDDEQRAAVIPAVV
jgi:hypothetical protein